MIYYHFQSKDGLYLAALEESHRRIRATEGELDLDGLDPVDIHASISALAFFNVANRHTFALVHQRDFASPSVAGARRASIIDMMASFLRR